MRRAVEATTRLRAAPVRAREVLLHEPHLVVAESRSQPLQTPLPSTLRIDVGATGVQQQIEIWIGTPTSTETSVSVPVTWRATTHRRLFPTFEGQLCVVGSGHTADLVLRGVYAVPLGVLGGIVEWLGGRGLAHRSLSTFLRQAAIRLDGEVARITTTALLAPIPYSIDLREVRSERALGSPGRAV